MEMKGVLGGNFPPRRVGSPQQRAGAGRDFSLPFWKKQGQTSIFVSTGKTKNGILNK